MFTTCIVDDVFKNIVMKKIKLNSVLLGFILLMTISCAKESSDNLGKVVFFSNAQAMLNCGKFNVDIYIGDSFVGSLSDPYVDSKQPECSSSSGTLVLEKEPGKYSCSAIIDCGQYGWWDEEIEIKADSCIKIFFDFNEINSNN